jgi:uncharacterized protein
MIAAQAIPFVLRESHTLNVLQSRIHGLDHWFRVWQNAQMLNGQESGADMEVVALFALFHDSMRVNDGTDPKHGNRGYKLWERFYQTQPELGRYFSDHRGELLFEACLEHNNGERSTDPTIATCWDADRLDLPRLGIWPDARYMSTQSGISLTITRITS